jgi:hypothetical protein
MEPTGGTEILEACVGQSRVISTKVKVTRGSEGDRSIEKQIVAKFNVGELLRCV